MGIWSMRSWEAEPRPLFLRRADSQDRIDQTHMIACDGKETVNSRASAGRPFGTAAEISTRRQS
jgi:hypothetical protein